MSRIARSLAIQALTLVAVGAACFPRLREPTREIPRLETAPLPTTFVAAVRDGQLELTNGTSAPVFTFIVGREMAKVVRWAPCVEPFECPPIAPGATRRVALPQGPGGAAEREALVNWWHRATGPDGTMQPDSIRTIVVPL